ncbi:MAG: hypothetical protein AABW67_05385 [Nanoarchaeota archaeon]
MINVNITNIKEGKEFQQKDIAMYLEMVNQIRESIKETGLEANVTLVTSNNPPHFEIFEINDRNKNYVNISPVGFEDYLSGIDINVTNRKLFEPIRKIAEIYKSKFKLVSDININKKF